MSPLMVLHAAASLLSDDGERSEYDRAIVELTCDLLNVHPDNRDVVKAILWKEKNS